eukprot:scaffold3753_cov257-Pinguiococcus_pyrenoidosus.AAC.4
MHGKAHDVEIATLQAFYKLASKALYATTRKSSDIEAACQRNGSHRGASSKPLTRIRICPSAHRSLRTVGCPPPPAARKQLPSSPQSSRKPGRCPGQAGCKTQPRPSARGACARSGAEACSPPPLRSRASPAHHHQS